MKKPVNGSHRSSVATERVVPRLTVFAGDRHLLVSLVLGSAGSASHVEVLDIIKL